MIKSIIAFKPTVVLRRDPLLTLCELIALLDTRIRKIIQTVVTGKLYSNTFVHTHPIALTNRPVTWSLK